MTMWGVFPDMIDGVALQKPIAMFREAREAEAWGMSRYGTRVAFKLKEVEIMKCDVVERTGLVWR